MEMHWVMIGLPNFKAEKVDPNVTFEAKYQGTPVHFEGEFVRLKYPKDEYLLGGVVYKEWEKKEIAYQMPLGIYENEIKGNGEVDLDHVIKEFGLKDILPCESWQKSTKKQ